MTLKFNSCCCCIELKTGCFIIGYLNLVGDIALIVLSALALEKGINDKDAKYPTSACALYLALAILHLIFVILLLVGLHKKRPSYLNAYLVYSVIFLVLSAIVMIVSIMSGLGPEPYEKSTHNVKKSRHAGYTGSSSFSFFLSIYFLLVIRSMYYRMKEGSQGRATY